MTGMWVWTIAGMLLVVLLVIVIAKQLKKEIGSMITRWIVSAVTAAVLAVASLSVTGCTRSEDSGGHVRYTCPMHPEVVQDKPGDCPKCGMKLVEKK